MDLNASSDLGVILKSKKLSVLIVDDEPLITLFIKDIVLDMQEQVMGVCHDSDCAIKYLKESTPNVVFMDINIQGAQDGITLAKQYVHPSDTMVFYISAYDNDEVIQEALETKPYNYLVKPVNEEDIKIALTLAKNNFMTRISSATIEDNVIVLSDGLSYDKLHKRLFYQQNEIKLSRIEEQILDVFITNPNINLSFDTLQDKVWKDKEIAHSTVRDVISKLRKRIPDLPIVTNFGRGYILRLN